MGDPVILAHYKTVLGQTYAALTTTTAGNQGQRVTQLVKPGNKFWAWPTISPAPTTICTGIDFNFGTGFSWGDGAPTASADSNVNLAILAELAAVGPTPDQVLSFA